VLTLTGQAGIIFDLSINPIGLHAPELLLQDVSHQLRARAASSRRLCLEHGVKFLRQRDVEVAGWHAMILWHVSSGVNRRFPAPDNLLYVKGFLRRATSFE
jgi:hypothetical protein